MLLTISTNHRPATDLSYLLHKFHGNPQSVEIPAGIAHVFYPEASEDRCTVAVLLDIDPIALVRGREGPARRSRDYVNDRPYVASSFMSVALRKLFSTAMSGTSKDRPELAATAIPLEAMISVLPSKDGEGLIRRLFEPLGYAVTVESTEVDAQFPRWGESPYHAVHLSATVRLSNLLQHLYVLIPVLDQEKHYWVTADEVDKLMRHSSDWLPSHPEQELIVRRYLRHIRSLTTDAMQRLAEEDQDERLATDPVQSATEELIEQPLRLADQRQAAILAALEEVGAARILDLGCGEGRLLTALLDRPAVSEIVGMDVAPRVLEEAARKLRLDRMPPQRAQRLKLIQGSLVYRDERLVGYDGAVLQEVIEHLDPPQLRAAERVVFEFARPTTVVVTTPNREYNALFATLAAGTMRHDDHRFEWSRVEFQAWAQGIAARRGYTVRHVPVGPSDGDLGSPTQMAVFQR